MADDVVGRQLLQTKVFGGLMMPREGGEPEIVELGTNVCTISDPTGRRMYGVGIYRRTGSAGAHMILVFGAHEALEFALEMLEIAKRAQAQR